MKWKYSVRKINGVRTRVKYHKKTDGGYLVRKIAFRNRHD